LGNAEVKVCTVNAAGTAYASIVKCTAGYLPLVFTDGTIKGCVSCAGLVTDVNTQNAATGYLGCKLPTVASAAVLTSLGVAGFNALITNLVCDNANSYF